jgi:HEAT repeat protein
MPRALRRAAPLIALLLFAAPAAGARLSRKPTAALLSRLEDAAPADRAALVDELARRRDPAAIPALARAVGDADRAVRRRAVAGLAAHGGALADPTVDQALLSALQDVDPEVVAAAERALGARLAAGIEPGAAALGGALARLGRAAPGWTTRRAAAALLGQAPGGDPVPALMEMARLDPHPEVRRAAVAALGQRGADAARGLLSRLKSTDMDAIVRSAAAEALGRMGGPVQAAVVAVLPFTAQTADLASFAATLQDSFTAAIAEGQGARVVERRQLDQALAELRGPAATQEGAVRVGALLRADQVVLGSVSRVGDEVTCVAKRVVVATGEVQATAVAGSTHDLAALQRACAARLLRTF